MNWEVLLLIVMYLSDAALTNYSARKFKKIFPDKDISMFERNFIVAFLFRKFGFTKGGILGFLILGTAFFVIIYFIKDDLNWIYFGLGTLSIVNWLHLSNLSQLSNLEVKK